MTWNPGADVVEVTRGPQQAGGAGGFYRAFGETLRGLRTTLGELASPVTTVQYPEEKIPVYPRFRGRHRLHVFEDTLRDHAPKPGAWGILLAMGPGFCSELVLLRAPEAPA